jgi:hypothetical protein
MDKDNPKAPNARGLQVVAAAILGAPVAYAVVGTALVSMKILTAEPIIPPDRVSGVGLVLILIGVFAAAASFLVRRVIAPRILIQDQSVFGRFRITIISMAVAESAGVIGLVYAILSQKLDVPFVLWGISLAASIGHFPTRAWLEGGSGK